MSWTGTFGENLLIEENTLRSNSGGRSGIRTHGRFLYARLVDECFRPLSHPSHSCTLIIYNSFLLKCFYTLLINIIFFRYRPPTLKVHPFASSRARKIARSIRLDQQSTKLGLKDERSFQLITYRPAIQNFSSYPLFFDHFPSTTEI